MTISLLFEVSEELHQSLRQFLESRPDWDQDRAATVALSLFLAQAGDRRVARIYLDELFESKES